MLVILLLLVLSVQADDNSIDANFPNFQPEFSTENVVSALAPASFEVVEKMQHDGIPDQLTSLLRQTIEKSIESFVDFSRLGAGPNVRRHEEEELRPFKTTQFRPKASGIVTQMMPIDTTMKEFDDNFTGATDISDFGKESEELENLSMPSKEDMSESLDGSSKFDEEKIQNIDQKLPNLPPFAFSEDGIVDPNVEIVEFHKSEVHDEEMRGFTTTPTTTTTTTKRSVEVTPRVEEQEVKIEPIPLVGRPIQSMQQPTTTWPTTRWTTEAPETSSPRRMVKRRKFSHKRPTKTQIAVRKRIPVVRKEQPETTQKLLDFLGDKIETIDQKYANRKMARRRKVQKSSISHESHEVSRSTSLKKPDHLVDEFFDESKSKRSENKVKKWGWSSVRDGSKLKVLVKKRKTKVPVTVPLHEGSMNHPKLRKLNTLRRPIFKDNFRRITNVRKPVRKTRFDEAILESEIISEELQKLNLGGNRQRRRLIFNS